MGHVVLAEVGFGAITWSLLAPSKPADSSSSVGPYERSAGRSRVTTACRNATLTHARATVSAPSWQQKRRRWTRTGRRWRAEGGQAPRRRELRRPSSGQAALSRPAAADEAWAEAWRAPAPARARVQRVWQRAWRAWPSCVPCHTCARDACLCTPRRRCPWSLALPDGGASRRPPARRPVLPPRHRRCRRR